MSDIFREVEEDVRRERFENSGRPMATTSSPLLVLVFVGIAGWQFWQRYELQQRAKASDAFIAAQRITNPQGRGRPFAELAQTAPKGYAKLAQLPQADAMFASGQRDDAIDALQADRRGR